MTRRLSTGTSARRFSWLVLGAEADFLLVAERGVPAASALRTIGQTACRIVLHAAAPAGTSAPMFSRMYERPSAGWTSRSTMSDRDIFRTWLDRPESAATSEVRG
jgi:hypothetical protein